MSSKQYAAAALQVSHAAQFETTNGITSHTHKIQFGRSLSHAEQHLFADILIGFYYTVHFSRQFGSTLVAEPVVEFLNAAEARYTLRQSSLSGEWKDLLFAILANFSQEVAPIHLHDNSQVFDPAYAVQAA